MVVGDIDADELTKDDEQNSAKKKRADERPEEPEEGVLIAQFEFAERQEVQQLPRSTHLPIDTRHPRVIDTRAMLWRIVAFFVGLRR